MTELEAVVLTRKLFLDIYINGYEKKHASLYWNKVRDFAECCPMCELYRKKLPRSCIKCHLSGDCSRGVCPDWRLWETGDMQGAKNIIDKCIERERELLSEPTFEEGEPCLFKGELVIYRGVVFAKTSYAYVRTKNESVVALKITTLKKLTFNDIRLHSIKLQKALYRYHVMYYPTNITRVLKNAHTFLISKGAMSFKSIQDVIND